MAHYDIRKESGAAAGVTEDQCNTIANIINTNYSDYLTATVGQNTDSKYPTTMIMANSWIVEIAIAKGSRQGEIIIVYGQYNSYGTASWNYLHSDNSVFTTSGSYADYTIGTGTTSCLDIIEIDNGLIFGHYVNASIDYLNSHGYCIYEFILFNEDNDCTIISNYNNGNVPMSIDKGNGNIYRQYYVGGWANGGKLFLSDNTIQFSKFFNGEKYLDNCYIVTGGQTANLVADVRQFTLDDIDYITLGGVSGGYNSYRNVNSLSFVFPLPASS